ncbi:hypothetical protein [uncultured Tateyamaria sp.]|uniref:hypothetical protein n=1 Tax=uncultured Tateyamaria sp. TaxID=455651 RepID=UPI0026282710|nr:hypothetical protein [uncultured Tateyamaria sp.]
MPPVQDPVPKTARIEVFRPGDFVDMAGQQLTYTAADLRAIADAYDFDSAPAPVVVGHPDADAPAYAWVTGFEFDAQAERLFANIGEIDTAFGEAVQAGRYKKVSMSFFGPDHSANPQPGTWYPKHVGFLGAAAPAVSGLKNVKFAIPQSEAVTFEARFGHRGFENTSRILQGLREFLIDRFGIEEADQALPSWDIEWLGDTDIDPSPARYRAPENPVPQPKKEEPVLAGPEEDDLKKREANLVAREKQIKHDDNVNFVEGLVTDGRLLPSSKDDVVALMDALPSEETVSFAESGDTKLSPGEALRKVLSAQPKVVNYGKLSMPAPGVQGEVAFSSDGADVDPGQLEQHAAALAYQKQHPGIDYLAAVKAVS